TSDARGSGSRGRGSGGSEAARRRRGRGVSFDRFDRVALSVGRLSVAFARQLVVVGVVGIAGAPRCPARKPDALVVVGAKATSANARKPNACTVRQTPPRSAGAPPELESNNKTFHRHSSSRRISSAYLPIASR